MRGGGLGKLGKMVGNGSRIKTAEIAAQYFIVVHCDMQVKFLDT